MLLSDGSINIQKRSNNVIQITDSSSDYVSVDISGWAAGSTHLVVARWDTNALSGSNHLSFSVDGAASSFSGSSTLNLTSGTIYIGSGNGSFPANALIQGLTIYRRPLYEAATPSGINVGNGDEISQIYNGGVATSKDPTLVTGSWDVVFALPTNSTTGALTTGTGNAWSHPSASNLLYTTTTNTGGFMMNGTYTSDGWTAQNAGGSAVTVSSLATAAKIYPGGYSVASAGTANQGIYYTTSSLASGASYVVRAVGNSDGTCNPQVKILRADNTTEISHLNGTLLSGRTAPDVYIFTFQTPAAEAINVALLNTAATGTCSWHQVEVLANTITNPSMETGTGNPSGSPSPWIPTGWTNGGANITSFSTGQAVQETTIVHSGTSSFKKNNAQRNAALSKAFTLSGFFMTGGWFYNTGGNFEGYSYGPFVPFEYHLAADANGWDYVSSTSAAWKHLMSIYRTNGSSKGYVLPYANSGSLNTSYADDIYAFQLTDVSLTVTPASQANSTETSGLRVDGADTLTQPITNLSASSGTITFKVTPRHNYADAAKFGSTHPVLAHFYYDANNYIKILWQSATVWRTEAKFNGTAVNADTAVAPTLNAGSTYTIKVTYSAGGSLTTYIDGVSKATNTGVVAFATAPATAYFGADNAGANQYDATFDAAATATTPTVTANITAPYYKFGNTSASIVNTDASNYIINTAPASTASHTLSAYVYDGTSGNVGGTVDSKVASLVFDSQTVATTYTDTGGGWWRLTYTPTYTGYVAGYASLNQDADQGLYTTANNKWLSQGFQTGQSVTTNTVTLYLKKVGAGTPTTTYYHVEIQTDSAGVPSGTIITGGSSACAAIRTVTTYALTPFTFSSPPSLTSGTQYHLVLKPYTDSACTISQGALDATNYVAWGYDSTISGYNNGDRSTGTGSTLR